MVDGLGFQVVIVPLAGSRWLYCPFSFLEAVMQISVLVHDLLVVGKVHGGRGPSGIGTG